MEYRALCSDFSDLTSLEGTFLERDNTPTLNTSKSRLNKYCHGYHSKFEAMCYQADTRVGQIKKHLEKSEAYCMVSSTGTILTSMVQDTVICPLCLPIYRGYLLF